MTRLLTLLTLFVMAELWADTSQPVVRVEIEPEVVNVGEAAKLTVTVLVPTWFSGAPEYPAFEVANMLTRLPANSSYPSTERVDGQSWAGIVRSYQLYPFMRADYLLDGLSMKVRYADPDDPGQALEFNVRLPAVGLRARVPNGAEGLDPYLAGSALRLAREIEEDTGALKQGDALVLRYSAELEGLSALFLPRLAPDLEQPGVSVYADQPVIEDADPARRAEKLTLVFERGADITLPGRQLRWWNTGTQRIETAVIEPLSFSVEGKPPSIRERVAAAGLDGWALARLLLLLGILIYLGWRLWPILKLRWHERIEAWRHSELRAFRDLGRCLREKDGVAVHHALLTWLQRLETGLDARLFARRYGDDALCNGIEALSRSLYTTARTEVDFPGLQRGLIVARRRYRKQRSTATRQGLPRLNP